ncbi:MAG TPA: hypothetical protein VJC17_03180 [Candidatus Dojkabacteria bacterium]|nr:hypothetical protein [Candidatus Dojkabacteria bacterium]
MFARLPLPALEYNDFRYRHHRENKSDQRHFSRYYLEYPRLN